MSTRSTRVWVLVSVLLGASAAHAQYFTSDFESGKLLTSDTPPGPWDSEYRPASLQPTSVAAHRGNVGAALVDNSPGDGGYDVGPYLDKGTNGSKDQYLRVWIRVEASNA